MTLLNTEMTLESKVAHRIGSRWSMVETEDLESHLFLWMLENKNTLIRWRDEDGDNGKLYVSLRREAAKFCAKEHAARVGQPIITDNFYTPDMVRRALPYIFESVPQTIVVENPVTLAAQSIPSDPNLGLLIITDIRQQFYGLNRDVRDILAWRFRDGLTLEEIAELKDMSKQGARKAVDRALNRLVDALAGDR